MIAHRSHIPHTIPDRVGSLRFLSNAAYAFNPLAVAHGRLLAGLIAHRIFRAGAGLLELKVEVGVVLFFPLCLVFGPMVVFAPRLAAAKRTGLREYGTLADRSVWRHGTHCGRRQLGSLQATQNAGSRKEKSREIVAAPGAVVARVGGRRGSRNTQQAVEAKTANAYQRVFAACMDGRGRSVK